MCNMDHLRLIYGSYTEGGNHIMEIDDIMDLFTNEEVDISDRHIKYAFGMSKMTVANENEEGAKKYNKISFVEYLECIVRVAY